MSKVTASQQFESMNYNLRLVGFDTLDRSSCLFNWSMKELSKWSDNELDRINHELFETIRLKEDVSNNKMYEAVRDRVTTIRTRRMLSEYEKKCESKRKEIEEQRSQHGKMASPRVERIVSKGQTITRISRRDGC